MKSFETFKFVAFLVLAGSFLAGCGKIEKDVRIIKGQDQQPAGPDFLPADAMGTWKIGCTTQYVFQGDNNPVLTGLYFTEAMAISQSSLTRDVLYWTDSACTVQAFSQHQTAGFTIGDPIGEVALGVSVTNLKTSLTPSTASVAQALNAVNFCGRSALSAGATVDVSASSCNSLSILNSTINAITIETSHPKFLILGDGKNGSMSSRAGDEYQQAQ